MTVSLRLVESDFTYRSQIISLNGIQGASDPKGMNIRKLLMANDHRSLGSIDMDAGLDGDIETFLHSLPLNTLQMEAIRTLRSLSAGLGIYQGPWYWKDYVSRACYHAFIKIRETHQYRRCSKRR
ncbi:hypothetical protein FQN57_006766 [Myotisia sp. PD_48]|nr:hypothetical protein FQN57_006766 [Myotisia sp. PD_48]